MTSFYMHFTAEHTIWESWYQSQLHEVIQSHLQEQNLPISVWGGERFPFLLLKLFSPVAKKPKEVTVLSLEILKTQPDNALSNLNFEILPALSGEWNYMTSQALFQTSVSL